MLRLLATRRWLIWLAVATVWAIACLFLGRWQWHRWQEKSVIQSRIDDNYNADPEPLSSLLRRGAEPAKADEWKQVSARGHYVGKTLMVRNRPGNGGDFGYETVNVFETGGQRVVVDRGWVPNGATARTPSTTPAPPQGDVTLVGWVRPSEKSLGRQELSGQLASISVADVSRATGYQLVGGYLRMRTETLPTGAHAERPELLDRPSQGQAAGINLSYALQWWAGGIAGYAFILLRARREHLDAIADRQAGAWDDEAPTDDARADDAPGDERHGVRDTAGRAGGTTTTSDSVPARDVGGAGAKGDDAHPVVAPGAEKKPRPTRPAKKRKPRKTRIWDEEDA